MAFGITLRIKGYESTSLVRYFCSLNELKSLFGPNGLSEKQIVYFKGHIVRASDMTDVALLITFFHMHERQILATTWHFRKVLIGYF